jgi:hypothetical protein
MLPDQVTALKRTAHFGERSNSSDSHPFKILESVVNKAYLQIVAVLSVVVAALISHPVTQFITNGVSRRTGRNDHVLAESPGNAILFGVVFVTSWVILSFLLMSPSFFWRKR